MSENKRIAKEAKALAVLAYRSGPIEDFHAEGRISQAEMKKLNKGMVDSLFFLLTMKERKPRLYWQLIEMINQTMVRDWDDPETLKVSDRLKDFQKLLR